MHCYICHSSDWPNFLSSFNYYTRDSLFFLFNESIIFREQTFRASPLYISLKKIFIKKIKRISLFVSNEFFPQCDMRAALWKNMCEKDLCLRDNWLIKWVDVLRDCYFDNVTKLNLVRFVSVVNRFFRPSNWSGCGGANQERSPLKVTIKYPKKKPRFVRRKRRKKKNNRNSFYYLAPFFRVVSYSTSIFHFPQFLSLHLKTSFIPSRYFHARVFIIFCLRQHSAFFFSSYFFFYCHCLLLLWTQEYMALLQVEPAHLQSDFSIFMYVAWRTLHTN